MKIEEALYAYLKAHAGLSALVGTRIYPLKLPQNPTLPAVTYAKVSLFGQRTLGTGNPRFVEARFQFSCWAKDIPGSDSGYKQAKDVAEQVKAALQDYSGLMGGSGGVQVMDADTINEVDIYEPDTGIYHVPVDVLVFHQ